MLGEEGAKDGDEPVERERLGSQEGLRDLVVPWYRLVQQ